jgi:Fur family peroxide stress response transcriptional regulator
MDKLALYLDTLKRAGLRVTGQRRAICEYLAATDAHPTPYEVYAEIAQAHPEISRATVYNTLNALQRLGAIVELSLGADHTHYDTDPTPHINLICLHCHRVEDYHGPTQHLPRLSRRVQEETGFLPMVVRADVLGFCAECRARMAGSAGAQAIDHMPSDPSSLSSNPTEAGEI